MTTPSKDSTTPVLIFVYNADSGLFNALTDIAHKALSPQTYKCNLCALTHSTFGMRSEWKVFLQSLAVPVDFLHADELKSRYLISRVSLPAVFRKQGETLDLLISSDLINACRTIDDLELLVRSRLGSDCFREGQEHT